MTAFPIIPHGLTGVDCTDAWMPRSAKLKAFFPTEKVHLTTSLLRTKGWSLKDQNIQDRAEELLRDVQDARAAFEHARAQWEHLIALQGQQASSLPECCDALAAMNQAYERYSRELRDFAQYLMSAIPLRR